MDQDRQLPPRASTGLALLIAEQTLQKKACVPRNTFLPNNGRIRFLTSRSGRRPQRKRLFNRRLPAPTIFESWLPMDSEIVRKGNCNARACAPWRVATFAPVFRQSPFRARLPKSPFIYNSLLKIRSHRCCRPATGSMSALRHERNLTAL